MPQPRARIPAAGGAAAVFGCGVGRRRTGAKRHGNRGGRGGAGAHDRSRALAKERAERAAIEGERLRAQGEEQRPLRAQTHDRSKRSVSAMRPSVELRDGQRSAGCVQDLQATTYAERAAAFHCRCGRPSCATPRPGLHGMSFHRQGTRRHPWRPFVRQTPQAAALNCASGQRAPNSAIAAALSRFFEAAFSPRHLRNQQHTHMQQQLALHGASRASHLHRIWTPRSAEDWKKRSGVPLGSAPGQTSFAPQVVSRRRRGPRSVFLL